MTQAIFCTVCAEWHPAIEGTGSCILDLDQGWAAFCFNDRWYVLCPNCTDKFNDEGMSVGDIHLKPYKVTPE